MIEILYFASLREQLGISQERITLPAQAISVAELIQHLRERGQPWERALGGDQTLMVAVNQQIAHGDALVHDGDEVALFPPVTGG